GLGQGGGQGVRGGLGVEQRRAGPGELRAAGLRPRDGLGGLGRIGGDPIGQVTYTVHHRGGQAGGGEGGRVGQPELRQGPGQGGVGGELPLARLLDAEPGLRGGGRGGGRGAGGLGRGGGRPLQGPPERVQTGLLALHQRSGGPGGLPRGAGGPGRVEPG
ncbi:MAG: hypothetical protein ACK559_39295, partial [bacterium]